MIAIGTFAVLVIGFLLAAAGAKSYSHRPTEKFLVLSGTGLSLFATGNFVVMAIGGYSGCN